MLTVPITRPNIEGDGEESVYDVSWKSTSSEDGFLGMRGDTPAAFAA